MSGVIQRWRRARILKSAQIDEALWQRALGEGTLLAGLTSQEIDRLRELCTMFLHDKQIHGAGGFELDDAMRLKIAVQACILILALPYEWYDGWVEVIVYPDEFVPEVQWEDEFGVVHTGKEVRAGEAWLQGPVVLSWVDVGGFDDRGINAALHEFAHKLDMVNGDVDGFPPLHAGMSRMQWTQAFKSAYDDMRARVDRDEETDIDPYACESPGEFFAVLSEYFFERPEILTDTYADVYAQMQSFYRQDPLARQMGAGLINTVR